MPQGLPVLQDRRYLGAPVQTVLADRSCVGVLPALGEPAAESVGERWVVERTFAWLGRWRRLSRDYEELPVTEEAWISLAMCMLMLARVAK